MDKKLAALIGILSVLAASALTAFPGPFFGPGNVYGCDHNGVVWKIEVGANACPQTHHDLTPQDIIEIQYHHTYGQLPQPIGTTVSKANAHLTYSVVHEKLIHEDDEECTFGRRQM